LSRVKTVVSSIWHEYIAVITFDFLNYWKISGQAP
jgi:hypothetical protein